MAVCAGLLAAVACARTLEPGSSSVCTQAVPFTFGDTVSDSLSANDCKQGNGALADFYTFVTTGQENIRISVSSPGLTTFLQLTDQRGAIIMNSALTSSLDTTTTVRMMVGAGAYALAVNAVSPGQSGKYRLAVTADTAAVQGCGTVWLTPGVLTTQVISNADCTRGPGGGSYFYHLYTVVLLQAQEANLSEHSTGFPPQMILVGPTGSITSSPDSLGTTALISSTITTQGAYSLWVGSSSSTQFGTYTLQVR